MRSPINWVVRFVREQSDKNEQNDKMEKVTVQTIRKYLLGKYILGISENFNCMGKKIPIKLGNF